MDLFAVFGSPIQHSLSPVMHNAAFRVTGKAAYYFPVEVTPDRLGEALEAVRRLGGLGVNLTRPLKETVLGLPSVVLAEQPWVRETGAANTLAYRKKAGVWEAGNTDAAALYRRLPPSTLGQPALVLGSGGVARASVAALRQRGYTPWLAMRRPQAAGDWTAAYPVLPWDEALRHPGPWRVVVNATPLGQSGEASWTDFPAMDAHSWVVDWVYHPLHTPLLARAHARQAHVVDGLSLLVEQAALAWQLWFGEEGPRDVMLAAAQGA